MAFKKLNSDQALAYGAMVSGVKIVTSYPGSPSSGTVDLLIDLAKENSIYVEWSSNERVALEMAIGASIVGKRALVCVKSVGMNVMLDPMMALNLTPVKGGLVILLGDDPGGYGSQNEQDTRQLAPILEMPMLEPASPSEAYKMMVETFELSEKFETTVIIRETRSFTQKIEQVNISDEIHRRPEVEYKREPLRFVPVPKNVVEKHKNLHSCLEKLSDWADKSQFNQIERNGKKGIIAAGFVYQKLLEVLGNKGNQNLKLLKLGIIYPLPKKVIFEFLKDCEEILVLEENEPFVEAGIKTIAQEINWHGKILGKLSKHVNREGELFRWQITESLIQFHPELVLKQEYYKQNEKEEIPKKEGYCGNCRYDEVLDLLEEAAEKMNLKLLVVGDPGCLVTVAERIDAKYSIGSAVAVAGGMSKTGVKEKPVALIGDSGFFHSTLPAICNAIHNKSNILMIVLDNESTQTSGGQPHPGISKNALREKAPKLSIQKISEACGINYIKSVSLDDSRSEIEKQFIIALSQQELAMLIVKIPS